MSRATDADAGDAPTPERDVLDDALARWTPSTGTAPAVARAQTRRAAEYLATTGERLGRTALADRLADGSTFDARTWWTDAVGPGIRRLVDAGIVDAGPDGFRWIGTDTGDTGGPDT
jgi:hypothetical protein